MVDAERIGVERHVDVTDGGVRRRGNRGTRMEKDVALASRWRADGAVEVGKVEPGAAQMADGAVDARHDTPRWFFPPPLRGNTVVTQAGRGGCEESAAATAVGRGEPSPSQLPDGAGGCRVRAARGGCGCFGHRCERNTRLGGSRIWKLAEWGKRI